jgi:hypothetical protein
MVIRLATASIGTLHAPSSPARGLRIVRHLAAHHHGGAGDVACSVLRERVLAVDA